MINPIIIIPDYKVEKTEQEQKCLMSLLPLLNAGIDCTTVIPKSLEGSSGGDESVFADYYFQSIITYSQLMESSHFWEDFLDYSHALIFQPDCFLLGDTRELEFWCKLNFFFVGAPHFKDYNYEKNPHELQNTFNGGFSLRNIKQHYDICKELERQGFDHKKCQAHEDTFWVQMAQKFNIGLPDPRTAARFSWEQGGIALEYLCEGEKPFGLHAPFKYLEQHPDWLIKTLS